MTFSDLHDSAPRRWLAWYALAGVLSLAACQDSSAEGESNGDGDTAEETPNDSESESGDDGPQIICEPGQTRCADTETIETCAPTGLKWDPSPCEIYQQCDPCYGDDLGNCVAVCVGPCEKLKDQPSSEGCSFYTTSMYQAGQTIDDPPDAIIVGNPNTELVATVELYFAPEGSNVEELVEGPIELMPGDSYEFLLPPELTMYMQNTSMYRSGEVHHIVSDLPIVAYLHSPYAASSTNGSSMLLPEEVMTGNYVVYGHSPFTAPSYFVVIALEDQTTVRWWPTIETAGDNLPLPYVEAGQMGEQLLNRLDNMRIDSSFKNNIPRCEHDLSGTVIEADKPIWVVSATRGARIPYCHSSMVEGCETTVQADCIDGSDFLQEQNLPLEFWGQEYIGPHSPLRGSEEHYWRIFAGDDDVTITVEPPQPGTPIHLEKRGEWQQLVVPNGTNLRFTGDRPFMPVQYMTGHYEGDGKGSPAMVQMVPTVQFLDNYVFVTGVDYESNFVQIMREIGSADVLLDGVDVDGLTVNGWAAVGGWEVATVEISEGAHQIDSADNFGIIQYGWSSLPNPLNTAGYAYPGGMKAEVIFIP